MGCERERKLFSDNNLEEEAYTCGDKRFQRKKSQKSSFFFFFFPLTSAYLLPRPESLPESQRVRRCDQSLSDFS